MDSIQINSPMSLTDKSTIKNRLFKSAMSEQLGDKSHNPTQGLVNVYRAWA